MPSAITPTMLKSLGGLSLFLCLCACAGPKNPSSVLIPKQDESGATRLTEVKLESLSNPHKVSGPAAVVYENPVVDSSGIHGKPAEPRLTAAGKVWIPLDVKSSAALSIYHGYELIKKFDDRVIPEYSVSWPRHVVFDLQIRGQGFVNNAYYQGSTDVTVILPYMSSGTAIAFNSAILAHEHFHAHFYKFFGPEVMEKLGQNFTGLSLDAHASPSCGLPSLDTFQKDDSNEKYRQLLNFFILRGWNEGLADFYAALVSGETNALDETLFTGSSRKINAFPGFMPKREMVGQVLDADINGALDCNSLGVAYSLGIQVARTLYMAVLENNKKNIDDKLSEQERDSAVKDLFLKLDELKDQLITQMIHEKVEPDWLVKQLLGIKEPTPAPAVIPGPGPAIIK